MAETDSADTFLGGAAQKCFEMFFFHQHQIPAARAAIFLLQLKHSARKFAQIDWVGTETGTKNFNFTTVVLLGEKHFPAFLYQIKY